MRWIKWLLLVVVLAALAGLFYFTRIQWGGPPMGPMPVLAAQVISATYQPEIPFTGRLSAVAEAEVRPQVAGTISKIHFTEGQLVKVGDALFTLDLRGQNPQARQAQAQAAQLKAAYERGAELRAADAISVADLEARKAAFMAANAATAEAGISGFSATIKAPIAGRVGRAEVTLGNVVSPAATRLTTIQQLNPMYVDFDMDEQTYLGLMGGTNAPLRGTPVAVGLASDGLDYPLEGTLTGIDNRLGATSGALRVRATVPNEAGTLLAGLFARVKLTLPTQKEALLVNDAAILTDQTLRFVYKVVKGGQPVRVVVKVGDMVQGLRAVTPVTVSDLTAQDSVVINGLMRIRPGSEVFATPADMRTLQLVSPTTPQAPMGK
jgi:membrane fusion protein, multidrug efflux system